MSLRPNSRTEVRKKSYKLGVDADEARRRREDNLVEIRKNKREDNLLKKRREGLVLQNQSQSQSQPLNNDVPQNLDKKVSNLFLLLDFCCVFGFRKMFNNFVFRSLVLWVV